MLLTRRSIQAQLDSGNLSFDPAIGPEQITASSIDLRRGSKFIEFSQEIAKLKGMGAEMAFDLGNADWDGLVNHFEQTTDVPDGEFFKLERGRLVLGWTREYIKIPDSLAGRVEGKSKPARLGLVVSRHVV
jgi:deoxycytidine triphosphate deaminase